MKNESNHEQPARRADDATKPARREILGSGAATAASMMFGFWTVACSNDIDDDEITSPSSSGPLDGPSSPDAGLAPPLDPGIRDGGSPVETATGDAASVLPDADIASLNALLTAEYNAITAYSAGAGLITGAKETDPLYSLRTVIKDIAVDFQSQHKLHAEQLVAAIQSLGGTPVSEAGVAAAFKPPDALIANPSITNVLKYAASAERGAAVSYNMVVSVLESAKSRFLATVIEGDESQHFIVLAALVLGLAGPGKNLSSETADDVVPEAFVSSIGGQPGLDMAPANYFA